MRAICANPASPLGENDFSRNQTGKLGVNMDEVKAHFDGMHGEIFDTMRDESIYRFDFDATTVEAVIDTPEEEK